MSGDQINIIPVETSLEFIEADDEPSKPKYDNLSKADEERIQKQAERYCRTFTEQEFKERIKAIGTKTDEFIKSEGMPTKSEEEESLAKLKELKEGLKTYTAQKTYLERIESNYLMLLKVGKLDRSIRSAIKSGGIPDSKYGFFDEKLREIKKDLKTHPEQNVRYSKIWEYYQKHKIGSADNLIQLVIRSGRMPNKEQHESLMERLKRIQEELILEKPKNQSEPECFSQAYKKVNGYFEEVFGNYGKFLQEKIGDEKETTRLKSELDMMVEHNHDEAIPKGSVWRTYCDYDFEVVEDQGPMVYGIWKMGEIAIGGEVGLTREVFWKRVKEKMEDKKK